MPEHRFIKTLVSGRYVIRKPSAQAPNHLLVGFHGYGQVAENELAILEGIVGASDWMCCSVEALHPFYQGKGMVGANWMTSRNRELMIEENVSYVNAVIHELYDNYSLEGNLVYHGFSMGAAMAVRAALLGGHEHTAVMLLGGNIPPEYEKLEKLGKVHIARGNADRLYTRKEFERDRKRLESSGAPFEYCCFPGGHEASGKYLESAGVFLKQLS